VVTNTSTIDSQPTHHPGVEERAKERGHYPDEHHLKCSKVWTLYQSEYSARSGPSMHWTRYFTVWDWDTGLDTENKITSLPRTLCSISTYYSRIMLNAFWYPKLCRHNLPNPTCRPSLITGSYYAGAYLCSQVVPDLIVYQQYSLRASA